MKKLQLAVAATLLTVSVTSSAAWISPTSECNNSVFGMLTCAPQGQSPSNQYIGDTDSEGDSLGVLDGFVSPTPTGNTVLQIVTHITPAVSTVPSVSTIPAVSTVPLPAAVWLFGAGIIGLVGVARRK